MRSLFIFALLFCSIFSNAIASGAAVVLKDSEKRAKERKEANKSRNEELLRSPSVMFSKTPFIIIEKNAHLTMKNGKMMFCESGYKKLSLDGLKTHCESKEREKSANELVKEKFPNSSALNMVPSFDSNGNFTHAVIYYGDIK